MTTKTSSDREFDLYLYAITHDLKSFSRAMRIIPDWITEDLEQSQISLPEEVAEHLSMLQHYARGMDRMLDGLTDLSRVGRLANAPEQIQLRAALDLAWTETGAAPGFSADFSQVDATILAPANDIQRLLQALLSNSVRHHDRDTGLVRAKTRQDTDCVILDVIDDGPGIDPTYHDKVFDPLHTLFPKDDTGFSGLGLTVARKVMDTLDGEITIVDRASTDIRGCTLRCVLPVG